MWSGPDAATSLRVPPVTGLPPDGLPVPPLLLLDELLQAASPAAARLAIAMTAIRWERRVMSRLLLAWHRRAQAYPWSPSVSTRIAGALSTRQLEAVASIYATAITP